eukprot:scaffold111654_cov45-Cyclotella_meneghiniana.AAC.7
MSALFVRREPCPLSFRCLSPQDICVRQKAIKACESLVLTPVTFVRGDYGGATNAAHVIAFSPSFNIQSSLFREKRKEKRELY